MKIRTVIFKRLSRQSKMSGVKRRDNYCQGKLKEQIENGVEKTRPDLIYSMNCNNDNFTKTCEFYNDLYDNSHKIKMHEFVQSPSKKDNITPEEVHQLGVEVANKYFKDYPCQVITHIDGENLHNHFLVANYNIENGKAFYYNNNFEKKVEKFIEKQYEERGLEHSIIKKEQIYKKEYRKRFYYDVKMKMNGLGEMTDKEILGYQLHQGLKNARSFEELQEILGEKNIKISWNKNTNIIRISHPEIVHKKGRSKGKVNAMDTKKLDEKYSLNAEQIEKIINENARLDRERFEKLSKDEKDREYLLTLDRNRLNSQIQNREQIRLDYNNAYDKALLNADEMKKNEVSYRQSKTDIERHKLMREREKLFEVQKDLQKEMIELNKKFEEIQKKIDELDKEISKKWNDRDNRIINDNEQLNKLPLDSDLGKLPQTVAINNEYEKTRNEDKVLNAHDLNGAEEIYKGIKEKEKLENANTKDYEKRFNERNERNTEQRTNERNSDGTVIKDRTMDSNVPKITGEERGFNRENNSPRTENIIIRKNERDR